MKLLLYHYQGLKRRDLLRHLETHVCQLLREGGNHTIYANRAARRSSSVPRHNEINKRSRQEDLQRSSGAATRRLTTGAEPQRD